MENGGKICIGIKVLILSADKLHVNMQVTFGQSVQLSIRCTSADGPLSLYLIFITRPYSNKASVTKMMHIRIHRSIIENVSDEGVFPWALPDMLISIRRIVIKSDIRPGIKSGGMMKLEKQIEYIKLTPAKDSFDYTLTMIWLLED